MEEEAADAARAPAPECTAERLTLDGWPSVAAAVGQRGDGLPRQPAGGARGRGLEAGLAGRLKQVKQGIADAGRAMRVTQVGLGAEAGVAGWDGPAPRPRARILAGRQQRITRGERGRALVGGAGGIPEQQM